MTYFNPDVYAGIDLSQFNGKLPFHLTNDYFFRAVMQENNRVLKALVCSLLHLDEEEVHEVLILNPIELGRQIGEKDFFLDIRILLDNRMSVNLEMQVVNAGNWVERSQCYLCRSFDSLNKGGNYKDILPAVQIGILDFTLFPESPEFFATYRLMNVKSHKIYSDKLRLSVLDLKQISLATEEDKAYHIDYWARLFKATTWKELKKMAEQYPIFNEAARTAVVLSEDEKIRQQCEAREDYYRSVGWMNDEIAHLASDLKQLASEKQQLTSEKQQLTSENQQLTSEKQQLTSENQQLTSEKQQLASEKQQLASEKQQLASENQHLASENERLRQLLANAGIPDIEKN